MYFALRVEPGLMLYGAMAGLILSGAGLALWRPGAFSPLLIGMVLVGLGLCLAGARAHQVAAPKLDFRYYGPVEGRVVALDRSASDAPRITLDRVVLRDTATARLPRRVRLSLHGPLSEPEPGQRVMTTAHLSPPQGPAEPGGFDFRRHAWFQGLGAVGYTRAPLLVAAPAERGGWAIRILGLRMAISARIRAHLPGDTGAFAAAVTTGDRSGISQAPLAALRASNLAHLLAISGLHMGLLAGVVFGALRLGLALIPPLALRWPVRKLAAFGALLAAAAYLALSGGNVATERAFIMVAMALVAVMCERRALSLRAVAMAALVVLALRPEALLSPGFQMSFAATTALVAVFTALRGRDSAWLPRWLRPAMGVFLSSAVAGLATAPVAAAHFNALAPYGLVANLVSVPVMGTVVVPAAVAAACLSPFGLEGLALQVMGLGLDWILAVAREVASWEGARRPVMAPGPAVLPMLVLGALWVILWQGRLRWAGLAPMVIAFGLWSGAERPVALVADDAGLVGVMTEAGRALSKPRGAGFGAGIWLENDGDLADQPHAAARWPGEEALIRRIALPGGALIHVPGKRAARLFEGCAPGDIVISTEQLTGPCEIFDIRRLRNTGSLAVTPGPQGLTIVTAREVSGQRLWNSTDPPRRQMARLDQ